MGRAVEEDRRQVGVRGEAVAAEAVAAEAVAAEAVAAEAVAAEAVAAEALAAEAVTGASGATTMAAGAAGSLAYNHTGLKAKKAKNCNSLSVNVSINVCDFLKGI